MIYHLRHWLQGRESVGHICGRHNAKVGDDSRRARLLHRRSRRQVRKRRNHPVKLLGSVHAHEMFPNGAYNHIHVEKCMN